MEIVFTSGLVVAVIALYIAYKMLQGASEGWNGYSETKR
ncbi:hypothetical protein SAMN04489841_3282 [Natrinema salaciae]|uniref:Uncharacterized protein n=1 Tax=Natrinema salaciae TaxID=1186196 RepID=A0A1H9MBC0_9EURY|nr:hypothetical protein SAMN04489841_3282 [Natrinema salaciae]